MCSLERESVQLIVHRLWTIGSSVLVVAYKIQIGGVINNIVAYNYPRYSCTRSKRLQWAKRLRHSLTVLQTRNTFCDVPSNADLSIACAAEQLFV